MPPGAVCFQMEYEISHSTKDLKSENVENWNLNLLYEL
tara:strand:+ start:41531 stop:41644 length:114 start_codon:yes stop_codon:yes gene_type:complete